MPADCVIKLPPKQNPEELDRDSQLALLVEALGISQDEIQDFRIRKYSFDARPRHMTWHLAFDVWMNGEEVVKDINASTLPPQPIANEGSPHVVVIGTGPAGLFCAMDLVRAGAKVTICERGKNVHDRKKDIAALNRGKPADPESNYCFGEGGAGTYSDGKLFTRSGRKKDVKQALSELVSFGAPDSILSCWRPHVGSNVLPIVIENFRNSLIAAGVNIRFQTRVDKFLIEDGKVTGVAVSGEGAPCCATIDADAAVVAAGHSSLDTLQALKDAGVKLEAKGLAMGVRVEHTQEWLDMIQYHGVADTITMPASFYEVSSKVGEHGVYSFCMCPGGWIVPSQTADKRLVVNGMSLSKRDSPFANAGIVVSINPEDWCGRRGNRWGWSKLLQHAASISDNPFLHFCGNGAVTNCKIDCAKGILPEDPNDDPLFGIRIQVALETVAAEAGGGENKAPAQTCADFVNDTGNSHELRPTSYLPGLTACNFRQILPKGLADRLHVGLLDFDKKLEGFASSAGQMIGVETRTSSPVRVSREMGTSESTTVKGIFPCGEGAGYAGGIVSAALDGRRVAAGVIVQVGLQKE